MHLDMFGLFWLPFSRQISNLLMLVGAVAMLASNFVPVQRTDGGVRTAMLIAAAAFAAAAVVGGGGTVQRLAALVLSFANLVIWVRTRPSDD